MNDTVRGKRIPRGTRISITFRSVPVDTEEDEPEEDEPDEEDEDMCEEIMVSSIIENAKEKMRELDPENYDENLKTFIDKICKEQGLDPTFFE